MVHVTRFLVLYVLSVVMEITLLLYFNVQPGTHHQCPQTETQNRNKNKGKCGTASIHRQRRIVTAIWRMRSNQNSSWHLIEPFLGASPLSDVAVTHYTSPKAIQEYRNATSNCKEASVSATERPHTMLHCQFHRNRLSFPYRITSNTTITEIIPWGTARSGRTLLNRHSFNQFFDSARKSECESEAELELAPKWK